MPVVGFTFKSINAERTDEPAVGTINIDSTPKILSVFEKKLPFSTGQPILTVGFEFRSNYAKLGNITIQGDVFYMAEDGKKILKDWNKNKRLPTEMDAEIRNFLFRKCLTFITSLTEDMQLPPPIGFPIILPPREEKEEEKQKYIG